MWAFIVLMLMAGCSGGADPPSPVQHTTVKAHAPDPFPPPVPVPMKNWVVQGTLADGGTVLGTFDYVADVTPTAHDVRSLSPNVVYPLKDWFIQAHQFVILPELVTFSQATAGNTAEFCIGQCVFASGQSQTLTLYNGRQTLRIAFALPTDNLGTPQAVSDWGTARLDLTELRSVDAAGAFQFLELWHSETIDVALQEVP